jgi:hemolysin activation/secretion protein
MDLPKIGGVRHDMKAGFNFKSFDTDVEFGGVGVFESDVHVAQFTLGYSGSRRDGLGGTSLSLEGFLSPGDLTGKNEDEEFDAARPGADPDYFYGTLQLERTWDLPEGFSLVNRFSGQLASERLVGSELMGFGGWSSVRGYEEREVNTDHGAIASFALWSPELELGRPFDEARLDSRLQFLAFWDYGHARIRQAYPGERTLTKLSGVGLGLRFRISAHLTFRCDFGYALRDAAETKKGDGNWHISVVASY